MFNVTEKASEMIKQFLKEREDIPAIRILLSQGGWSGPSLGMALDEPQEQDLTFKDRDITYVIDKDLFSQVKPVTVDYVNTMMGTGFNITSSMKKQSSCGSSSCSC